MNILYTVARYSDLKTMLAYQDLKQIIHRVNTPHDVRQLSIHELTILADELRAEIIKILAPIGGHLGAGLGVVELTIALHYVFNTPVDQLVWDIGHQAYPHKFLTGRKHLLHTIRQPEGLSGFLKRSESEYDVFGAGHSSTSISAALGIAAARDLQSAKHHVIAVIGDGALTAGMAYEAMNNAWRVKTQPGKFIVILNDNDMSIAKNVGAMQKYLNRLTSSPLFLSMRSHAKNLVDHMPSSIANLTKQAKKHTKGFLQGNNFFEELGFYYVGPVDGHDIKELIPLLETLRDDTTITKPILVHVKTEKGKGFISPTVCGEKFHAVGKFNPETKVPESSNIGRTYTNVFAEQLLKIATEDEKVVAITAAMPSGTGLTSFAANFHDRFFDVGIAEQHAVTFAAGLATQGMKPFCAIYSTFLQRAYDQVVHDVALQSLPVRFAIDRAGFVGGDGPTHAGIFDIAYLSNLPNMVVMAAADEYDLQCMVLTAHQINDRPSAFRYPRGKAQALIADQPIAPLSIGKAQVIQKGEKVAVLCLGTRMFNVMQAAKKVQAEHNFYPTIVNARFAKPLDTTLISELAQTHDGLLIIEDGTVGGFSSHVMNFLSAAGLLHSKLKVINMYIKDDIIEHNDWETMYEQAGLGTDNIVINLCKLLYSKSVIKGV